MKPTFTQYVNVNVLMLFPKKTAEGKTIIDEQCACGHLRSNHHNRFAVGHGECGQTPCDCTQFTWVKHIFTRVRP